MSGSPTTRSRRPSVTADSAASPPKPEELRALYKGWALEIEVPTQLIAEQQDDDPSPTDSFSHATTPSPRSRLTLRRPSNVLAIPPPNTWAKLRNAAKLLGGGGKAASPGGRLNSRRGSLSPRRPPLSSSNSSRFGISSTPIETVEEQPSKKAAAPVRAPPLKVEAILNRSGEEVETIEMSGLDDKRVRPLAAALIRSTMVETLNLSFNVDVEEVGLATLTDGLVANRSLTSLNLSGCTGLSDAGVARMVERLAQLDEEKEKKEEEAKEEAKEDENDDEEDEERPRRPMRVLNLSCCTRVGDKAATAISLSLPFAKSQLQLEEINLGGCSELTDGGVKAIAQVLHKAPSLTSLSLQGCSRVTDEGVSAIASALLADDCVLQTFNLSWMMLLTDTSLISLSEAIGANCELQCLDMSCLVELTFEGFKSFASSLAFNGTLTTFSFAYCKKLDDECLRALTHGMVKNKAVTTIDLEGCPCMKGEVMALPSAASTADSNASKANKLPSSGAPEGSVMLLRHYLQRNNELFQRTGQSELSRGALKRSAILETKMYDLKKMLRVAITQGSQIYSGGGDGGSSSRSSTREALDLFLSTAESIVAASEAELSVGEDNDEDGEESGEAGEALDEAALKTLLWRMRLAFDEMIDRIDERLEVNNAKKAELGLKPSATRVSQTPAAVASNAGGGGSPRRGSSSHHRGGGAGGRRASKEGLDGGGGQQQQQHRRSRRMSKDAPLEQEQHVVDELELKAWMQPPQGIKVERVGFIKHLESPIPDAPPFLRDRHALA